MEISNKQRFAIFSAIVLIVVVLLAWVVFTMIQRVGKTEVEISTVPSDASVMVNDINVSNRVFLEPGYYTLSVSRDGFKPHQARIAVSRSSQVIPVGLETDTSTGEDYLRDNPEEQLKAESLGGLMSQQQTLERTERNPLLNRLPHTSLEGMFRLDYGGSENDPLDTFILVRNSSTDGRKNALEWIRSQGVDINSIDIRFEDYVSPLVDRVKSERGY